MRLNLNQLSVFYLVGRHKQMAAAAKALFISTPAVAMQIRKLEHWLGFPVFERGRGALRFTERGRALYDVLEPICRELDGLERYIQDLVNAEEEELGFGTHHLPGNYFIPDMLAHVQVKYPNLKVRMEINTQDKLLEEIAGKNLDLALIIGEAPAGAQFRTQPLFNVDMALVTAAGNALARLSSVTVRELASIPLILQQKGTGVRREVLAFLQRNGVSPNISLDNLSSDVIKQFLPTRETVALIGRFIVQQELDEGLFHEIQIEDAEPPVIRFFLAYLDSPYVPLKIRRFLDGAAGFQPGFSHPAA